MSKKKTSSKQPEIPAQKKRLYQDVEFLTAIKPPRNYQNLASLQKTIDYIVAELGTLDFRLERQKYEAEGSEYQNIIATYRPHAGPRVVVGAHYDVCGEQPGADDNASAVAGLLEIGRLLHALKPDLPYQVDLVAFSLEEPPFFGSEYMGSMVHARSLKEEGVQLKAMICLEMIGYYSDEPDSQKYPVSVMKALYPSVGNFIGVIGNMAQGKLTEHMRKYMLEAGDIPVYSVTAPVGMTGIDFSDHRSYWAMGYPAVMINDTSFFRNPHYHQTSDTIDTLDFDRMTEVVKGVYWALVNFE